jgi:hypothetical protein
MLAPTAKLLLRRSCEVNLKINKHSSYVPRGKIENSISGERLFASHKDYIISFVNIMTLNLK